MYNFRCSQPRHSLNSCFTPACRRPSHGTSGEILDWEKAVVPSSQELPLLGFESNVNVGIEQCRKFDGWSLRRCRCIPRASILLYRLSRDNNINYSYTHFTVHSKTVIRRKRTEDNGGVWGGPGVEHDRAHHVEAGIAPPEWGEDDVTKRIK